MGIESGSISHEFSSLQLISSLRRHIWLGSNTVDYSNPANQLVRSSFGGVKKTSHVLCRSCSINGPKGSTFAVFLRILGFFN